MAMITADPKDVPQVESFSFTPENLAKAKALMAEAGYANGLETSLSFDLGGATIGEPMVLLIQEALAAIGIKTTINKIPGATWRAALLKKDMPLLLNRFGGWLDYPEYFFFWCYHSQNAVFNTMSYQNPKLDKVITNANANWGFNALTEKYEDLLAAGVIDPAKVARCALQNAASVASLMLTTETLIAEKPKKEAAAAPGGMAPGMGGGYGDMM